MSDSDFPDNFQSPSVEQLVYANKVERRIMGLVGYELNVRRSRILMGGVFDSEFFDRVLDAEEQGIITEEERTGVWDLFSVVLRGESPQDRSPVYATVKIAATIEDRHIDLAATRADVLRRATGEETIPAVVGARIDDVRRELAHEKGVTLVHVSFEDVKMVDVQHIDK